MCNLLKSFAFIVIFINIYLAGIHRGVFFNFNQYGIDSGVIGSEYFIIILFVMVFLIFLLWNKKIFSPVACVISLLPTILQYKYIYSYINGLSDEGEPFMSLFNEAVPLNVISFGLIVSLMVIQIIVASKNFFNKNTEIV